MTDNNHPITPPDDLQEQWKQEWLRVRPAMTPCIQWMLAKSARWGYEQRGADNKAKLQKARDEELEACCEWLDFNYPHVCITMLRASRRPKPLSLKEQALEALNEADQGLSESEWRPRSNTIRRALERLQELEGQANG